VDGLIYEYDGMKDLGNFDGGCSLVQSGIPFCTVLKKKRAIATPYRAVNAWYKIK
jgi:hypothetical protein